MADTKSKVHGTNANGGEPDIEQFDEWLGKDGSCSTTRNVETRAGWSRAKVERRDCYAWPRICLCFGFLLFSYMCVFVRPTFGSWCLLCV